MASDRGVWVAPIECTDDNDDFTLGVTAKEITNGVYACIATFLQNFENRLGLGYTVSLTSDFMVKIDGPATFSITWDDTDLRDLLGFTANLSGADTYTATYTPQLTWFPNRVRADRERWGFDHDLYWAGVETSSGDVPGLVTGDEIYRLGASLMGEHRYNVFYSAQRTAFEGVRSLDYFVKHTRQAWPTEDGNVSVRVGGFYYYPDYTDCQPLSDMDSGGVLFDLSSSPDTYVFCHWDTGFSPSKSAKPWLRVGRDFYNVDIPFHTATAPSWTVDGRV